ncbi:BatD family protein [Aeromonas australiensis]|uniref:BatD family protein n=1 Tax=Aeromonas australiensis TaxID=1114880 RepID=UPI0006939F14|nr:BatD family protein [Aeromonas australiensis]
MLALVSPLGWALPPRAELLPGTDPGDWLLIIEADGERQSSELEITPLLRQFAVGRVTMSRVNTPVQQLTRWQIPLHQSNSPAATEVVIAPLKLGNEFTPSLTLPSRATQTAALPQPPAPSPLEMQASLDHQGPLYPGQPVIYRLTLWLPTSMQNPALSELSSAHFTIRRLGSDEWIAPAQAGLPGRLTRSWLIQANAPGLWHLESPRLQGQLTQQGGQPQRLSARAAPLEVRVDKAPATPVATRLTLSQRLEPATTGEVGEPLIRILTLTMENGDSGQIQLAPLMVHQLPAGVQAHPDGEQQQERYRDGKLLFERQWRQTLVAEQSGDYLLPPIDLPWFNTQSGRIEQASLPAISLTFQRATNRQPDKQPSQMALQESLWWVVLALALRALWRHSPRWRAFYRLQRTLGQHQPDASRKALIQWATLRWQVSYYQLGQLPDARHNRVNNALTALERACFARPSSGPPIEWRALARSLRADETAGIAHLIYLLAQGSSHPHHHAP